MIAHALAVPEFPCEVVPCESKRKGHISELRTDPAKEQKRAWKKTFLTSRNRNPYRQELWSGIWFLRLVRERLGVDFQIG